MIRCGDSTLPSGTSLTPSSSLPTFGSVCGTTSGQASRWCFSRVSGKRSRLLAGQAPHAISGPRSLSTPFVDTQKQCRLVDPKMLSWRVRPSARGFSTCSLPVSATRPKCRANRTAGCSSMKSRYHSVRRRLDRRWRCFQNTAMLVADGPLSSAPSASCSSISTITGQCSRRSHFAYIRLAQRSMKASQSSSPNGLE